MSVCALPGQLPSNTSQGTSWEGFPDESHHQTSGTGHSGSEKPFLSHLSNGMTGHFSEHGAIDVLCKEDRTLGAALGEPPESWLFPRCTKPSRSSTLAYVPHGSVILSFRLRSKPRVLGPKGGSENSFPRKGPPTLHPDNPSAKAQIIINHPSRFGECGCL